MKKISLFLAAATMMGLASCSSDLLVDGNESANGSSKAIVFEDAYSNNSTRSSVLGSRFGQGAQMEVYGFQTTASVEEQIFDDQLVICNGGGNWTYSPVKYWNPLSTYAFYAAYPAGNYAFNTTSKNFTISNFVVAPAIADQTDLMIAEENRTTPGNTVTMNFNHLLSQVNFYAKIHENMQTIVNGENKGVVSGAITGLTITGLKNSGNFVQNGFNANNFNVVGDWTSGGSYTFPTIPTAPVGYNYVKCGEMTTDEGNVLRDLLIVPQALNATLTVSYSLTYADGTTSSFTKSVPLESIKFNNKPLTSWQMNTIYNYVMTLDPTRAIQSDFTGIGIDWDGSTNGDCEPTPGSTLKGPDADGNYTVEVDTDGDGTVDVTYPVVWEDVDGDGRLEAGIDSDGDGHIDNVDGDSANNSDPNNPNVSDNGVNGKDVILVDTDGDGKPDTQLEQVITSIVGPEDPTRYSVDYDGSNNGDAVPSPNSKLVQDTNGDYLVLVDTDGDGIYDTTYRVKWADLDGDGKEEGYIDNMDGENVNTLDPNNNPIWQQVTDGKTQNPNGYDVILVDTDGNGTCETQLERSQKVVVTPDPLINNAIEFSAQVEYWDTTSEGDIDISK